MLVALFLILTVALVVAALGCSRLGGSLFLVAWVVSLIAVILR